VGAGTAESPVCTLPTQVHRLSDSLCSQLCALLSCPDLKANLYCHLNTFCSPSQLLDTATSGHQWGRAHKALHSQHQGLEQKCDAVLVWEGELANLVNKVLNRCRALLGSLADRKMVVPLSRKQRQQRQQRQQRPHHAVGAG
jgi:hypothetical protein